MSERAAMQDEALTLFTDGGASPNPGPGGWGVVGVVGDEVAFELSGGEPDSTNNRMELTAAIEGLASQPAGSRLRLVTDSQYLRQGITSWIASWRRNDWMRGRPPRLEPVKNADLWRRLDALNRERDVRWEWVKGHAGHRFNERADELASAAIAALGESRPATARADAAESASAAADDAPDCIVTVAVRFSRGRGAWALHIDAGSESETVVSQERATSSANRLELAAALELTQRAERLPAPLEVRCGDYLRRGVLEWLPSWQRSGWRTAGGDPVKNRDLWERLEARLRQLESSGRSISFARADGGSPQVRELKAALRG